MKKSFCVIIVFLCFSLCGFAQQVDWTGVEKVFGRKGTIQEGVWKIAFPRSDLKVKVGDFSINPGLALSSWVGIIKAGDRSMEMGENFMMMGDLVCLEKEVSPVISKIVSSGLRVAALHNHLIGERPAIKYIHFSGQGEAVKLAEEIKSVLSVTGTPLSAFMAKTETVQPDWSKVEAVLGAGKHNGNLLQYNFPRREKLTESGMEMPASIGMATGINFQMQGSKAAITGDFVLLADEVNPVVKALSENGILVTAIHNHMLYDNPRLFMMHFWAVNDPATLAKGLKEALGKTNSISGKR